MLALLELLEPAAAVEELPPEVPEVELEAPEPELPLPVEPLVVPELDAVDLFCVDEEPEVLSVELSAAFA